ncbi:MAG: 1-phosphofructokinase [Ruminococcaceae bacterium]|nr:1-phosphofructokinase [Oscillospiraceae bacterium]
MIYTVTLNPSCDYYLDVDSFKEGIINRAKEERIVAGGKGINVSLVLNNLGKENIALGYIAGDTGKIFKDMIESMSLKSSFIQLPKGNTRINVKIKSEKETDINAKGPSVDKDSKDKLFEKLKLLKEGDWLVLSGSLPRGCEDTFYAEILEMIAVKGVKTVVDACGGNLMNTLVHNPFLVKPNNFELEELFNVKIKDYDTLVLYAKKLKDKGAKNVLVSLGKDGALLLTDSGDEIYEEAPKGKVVDTNGAGDSMVAGFISCYEDTGDYKKSLHMALCTGSATAFSKGLATYDDIMKLYER